MASTSEMSPSSAQELAIGAFQTGLSNPETFIGVDRTDGLIEKGL